MSGLRCTPKDLTFGTDLREAQSQPRRETNYGASPMGVAAILTLTFAMISWSVPVLAQNRMRIAPDGSWVAGQPRMAPNGSWVGGRPQMAPDGSWVGGKPQLAPDGSWVGGKPQLAPDGHYVG